MIAGLKIQHLLDQFRLHDRIGPDETLS
jgi:hypothetical protein